MATSRSAETSLSPRSTSERYAGEHPASPAISPASAPGPRGGREGWRPARGGSRRRIRSEQNSQRSEHITARRGQSRADVAFAGRGYPCVLMATLLSVNVGRMAASRHTDTGVTGIDKRPSPDPVALRDPGPETGRSGVAGDSIGDARSHGGTDQAVYAYAREDLDHWQAELGRPLDQRCLRREPHHVRPRCQRSARRRALAGGRCVRCSR